MASRVTPQRMEMWSTFKLIPYTSLISKDTINVDYPNTKCTIVTQIQELGHKYVNISLT